MKPHDHWSVRLEQIKRLMKKSFGRLRSWTPISWASRRKKIQIENSRIVNQNSLWNESHSSVTCEMRDFFSVDEQSFYSLLLVGFTNYCCFPIRITDLHRCARFFFSMLYLQIDYWTVLECKNWITKSKKENIYRGLHKPQIHYVLLQYNHLEPELSGCDISILFTLVSQRFYFALNSIGSMLFGASIFFSLLWIHSGSFEWNQTHNWIGLIGWIPSGGEFSFLFFSAFYAEQKRNKWSNKDD